MKIITWSALKGGVGKTVLCYNFAEYLANKGYKILLIDFDHQCNLSQIYNCTNKYNNVTSIFDNEEVDIHKVKDNIDFISGSYAFDKMEDRKDLEDNRNFFVYMWFGDNYEMLKQYDYIMFDTHNDFKIGTRNAIACSDLVYSPDRPTGNNDNNEANIISRFQDYKEEMIDVRTREQIIKADLYFIGNMVKHNTSSSKEFLENMQKRNGYLTYFDEKELFTSSVKNRYPVVQCFNDKQLSYIHKDFLNRFINSCKILEAQ